MTGWMPWAAEYRDTIEAEQLRKQGPRRPPMRELPPPEQAAAPEAVAPEEPLTPAPSSPSTTPVIRLHGMCVYCGHGPTQGSPATCWSHRGLDRMDPYYNPSILW